MVSPPTSGHVEHVEDRAERPGSRRKVTSVCHQLARSSWPSMARTSGCSSMAGSTGWASVTSPNWRAKSACWCGVRDWSRKKTTWCVLRACPHRAATAACQAGGRSSPGSRRRWWARAGRTSRLVARVTGHCARRSGTGPQPVAAVAPPRCSAGQRPSVGTRGGTPMRESGTRRGHGLFPTPTTQLSHRGTRWMTRLAATEEADPLPDGDLGAFAAWRERFAARLTELLGPWPAPVPLDTETLEVGPCDGYRRDRIVFDTEDTMSVPAYLLVPDGRPPPGAAVLAVHGHGPGKSQACGLEHTDAPEQRLRRCNWPGGATWCSRPDLRCFGERLDWNPEDHYACDTNLVHAVMAGWNPLTQNLWDLCRALDVLGAHPARRPAASAWSGSPTAGTMTLFLAASDPRVAAAVVSGYFSSWAEPTRCRGTCAGPRSLVRHARPPGARGPRRTGRPPAPPRRDRDGETRSSPCGRHRVGRRTAPRLCARRCRRTAWSTTSSRAIISGTASLPSPFSTAGSRTRPSAPEGQHHAGAPAREPPGHLAS